MYTGREIKPAIILLFAWKYLLFALIYSVFLCALNYWGGITLTITFVPIGLIGTAVAFYVGFKNNSSYERLWEARRIWGSIVNASRTWATFTLTYIKTLENVSGYDRTELHQKLIYRHLAYINALRIQLRKKSIWNDNNTAAHTIVKENIVTNEKLFSGDNAFLRVSLLEFLPEDEVLYFLSKKNPATHIMKSQAALLDEVYRNNGISEFLYAQMMTLVQEFYNQQGAAERIKSFPFPRQYAYFSKLFVALLVLILPFGLMNEFAKLGAGFLWMTVPCYIVISWVFITMEVVGDSSENPFENAINDIPMTAICRTIEIDLREMLEEEKIPAAMVPVNHILM